MKKKKKRVKRKKNPYNQRRFKNRKKSARSRESDPFYVAWRVGVKDRDGGICQWPGCRSKHRLEAHHIRTWAKYPALRYCQANGITLCSKCHFKVRGKEQDFEMFFYKILEHKMINVIRSLSSENKNESKAPHKESAT